MKCKIVLVSLLLGSIGEVAAAPPNAEPPVGSRSASRLDQRVLSEKDAAEAAHQFAKCVVNGRERDVHAFLSPDEGASTLGQISLLRQQHCVRPSQDQDSRRVTFPPGVLRGLVAEHWLKKSAAQVGLLQSLPPQGAYERPWFFQTGRSPLVDEMGACVADINPTGITSLIRTEPYSDQEKTALAALAPSMGPCLRAGAKLDANRQALRAALAEALYHRVRGPASASTQSAAPNLDPLPLFAGDWQVVDIVAKEVMQSCKKPDRIRIAPDRKTVLTTSGVDGVTTGYTVLRSEKDRVLMLIEGEDRKTERGEPVQWWAIFDGPDRFYWRRYDWPDGRTPVEWRRCPAR